jgi:hypothetical protein
MKSGPPEVVGRNIGVVGINQSNIFIIFHFLEQLAPRQQYK